MSSSPPPGTPSPSNPPRPVSAEDQAALDWLHNVYQGDRVRQFTPRAVITGMLIGGIMSISNLYVGLKSGWGLGVTITAAIIAFAVFQVLQRVIPPYRTNHFTVLENYTMSSAASAAGYMASAGLVSATPALFIATGRALTWYELMLWIGSISILGVFMAIPLKRQLINIEQLPFPTGTATAETLRSIHSSGAEAMQKAKSLIWGGVIGAIIAFWRKGVADLLPENFKKYAIPEEFPLVPGERGRHWLEAFGIGLPGSVVMLAAGAIMGIRVGVSLLLGGIIFFAIIGPILVEQGIVAAREPEVRRWTLWPATSMMVTAGLLAFGMRWRTILRAFSGLSAIFGKKQDQKDPLAHIEVPGWWFAAGTTASGLAVIILGKWMFGIDWWMGLLAVMLTFLLSIVAARATGETDITPIGAMGKITQLTYGVIAPRDMGTNLMTASITAGASSHSADLLSDLKSGYLLGGNPRYQTLSQLFGVLAGSLLCVPVYLILVDLPAIRDGKGEFKAPAAQVWASVAKLLGEGINNLPPGTLSAIVIGGLIGIVLTLAEEFSPRSARKWIPSATGLGLAGVITFYDSLVMFLGAFIAWVIAKRSPEVAEKYTVSVSSGMIAGESLLAVGINLYLAVPTIVQETLRSLGMNG